MEYLLLLIGFVLLIKGADFFVEGSSSLAKILKVPSVIIGLTIVAMGTSAPEASVSINAALSGSNDIAISNVVGSNIFNGLPRERRTEILRRNENDAVLHGRRGRHVPALLAHLNLGARGLDLSGLLVPDCRAALRAFIPGQIDLKLIAQRLERREQVAALIAVRRRLKVERLSVAVAQLVVHLIDDLVRFGPAEHSADRCRHQLDREHDERDQKHDHQCQHAVVALAFSTAAARTCIAVRRTICHFELFPSCLLHPGNAFCILRGGRLL